MRSWSRFSFILLALAARIAMGAEAPAGRRGAACLAAGDGVIAAGGQGGVDLYVGGSRRALGSRRNAVALLEARGLLFEAGGRAGEYGRVLCWNWKEEKLRWSAEPHSDLATSLAIGRSAIFSGGADRSIAILDPETGERRGRLEGHSAAVLALAASPNGDHLVSAGADRSLRVWEIGTTVPLGGPRGVGTAPLRTLQSHQDAVNTLAWSPDGRYLASGSADRTVRIWQPAIGRLVRIIRGHDGAVLSLAWHPSGLYTGSADGRIRRIDGESDAVLETLDAHRDWVAALAFQKDTLVSADWTGRVLVWKGGRAEELR